MPDLDRMPPEPPADAYYECRRVGDARSAKEPPRLSVWSPSERGAEAAEVRVDAVRRLLQAGGLGDVVVLADRGGRAHPGEDGRRTRHRRDQPRIGRGRLRWHRDAPELAGERVERAGHSEVQLGEAVQLLVARLQL